MKWQLKQKYNNVNIIVDGKLTDIVENNDIDSVFKELQEGFKLGKIKVKNINDSNHSLTTM